MAILIVRGCLIGCLLFLSACTSVFFYPDQQSYYQPAFFGIEHDVVELVTDDGLTLHNWWLKPQGEARGVVFFLHGNAENISSHIASVSWLPAEGYAVFMFEYRGFGQSEGMPDVAGIMRDMEAGLNWLASQENLQHLPRYMLGQSLGATLAAYYTGKMTPDIDGLILDAPFTSFRNIAREKLASWWLSWPFQYPLSWTVPDQYDVIGVAEELSDYPVLLFHGSNDLIVPDYHGQRICLAIGQNCQPVLTRGRHISTFSLPEYRQMLLEFMAENGCRA